LTLLPVNDSNVLRISDIDDWVSAFLEHTLI
jgi:hypothetical protein